MENVRKLYVMEAVEEIEDAKLAEKVFLTDERKRKVGGGPPYSATAPRQHKRASARDVVVWLAWKRLGKFGIWAIEKDLHDIKKR